MIIFFFRMQLMRFGSVASFRHSQVPLTATTSIELFIIT